MTTVLIFDDIYKLFFLKNFPHEILLEDSTHNGF